LAAALVAGLLISAGGASAKGGDDGSAKAKLDRVFIIMLENHSEHSVIGDPNAPFITSLATKYAEATNYFGVTHPSEPNYVAATSGSNWFTNNDNPANVFDHTNIVDDLNNAGISWAAYMDALPSAGDTTQFWPSSADPLYANKHDPFVLYADILNDPSQLSHIKPYTDLAADLSSNKSGSHLTSATTCTVASTTRSQVMRRRRARTTPRTMTRATSP
jgi:hypothetical protein